MADSSRLRASRLGASRFRGLRQGRFHLGEKGFDEEQGGTANEAAIGDVENGPIDIFMPPQEIPHAAEDDPVIKIAERAAQNEAEREAQIAIGGGPRPGAPKDDPRRRQEAHDTEDEVRRFG